MSDTNQYALSRILGSTMRPVNPVSFGNFGLLDATASALRAREANDRSKCVTKFGYEQDAIVAKAFEETRNGASPDSLLWDRKLSHAFSRRCRKLGIDAPDAMLSRRLINIRKNKKRYETNGIKLSPTTKKEPHASIVPQYAHVIEFALVKLRYRYGSSIDDILLDPELSEKYEKLALSIAPKVRPLDLRLGALYIRKSRYIKKAEKELLASLNPKALDAVASKATSIAELDPQTVPSSPGLLEVREDARYLYISRNENLRPAVDQFVAGNAFDLMGNAFWKPDMDRITVQFVPGKEVGGFAIQKWEHRLIYDYEPVFNWPMRKAA